MREKTYVVSYGYTTSKEKLLKERDQLRSENEKLKAVLENIVKTANGFKIWSELGVKADNGETIIDMIENTAQQALKEVTK